MKGTFPTCGTESNPGSSQDSNLGHRGERQTCYHGTTKPLGNMSQICVCCMRVIQEPIGIICEGLHHHTLVPCMVAAKCMYTALLNLPKQQVKELSTNRKGSSTSHQPTPTMCKIQFQDNDIYFLLFTSHDVPILITFTYPPAMESHNYIVTPQLRQLLQLL